jgi:hypothetical protein
MKILIACEESDEVRSQFENLGFDAYSCDILPNRNNNAKHFQNNIFDIINNNWDLMIAFPPCTDLASSGAAWFKKKIESGQQQKSIDFFLKLANANIKHIAIENPIGIMSKIYKKPDQIIQPYYFGDPYKKTTCLWLKNLPKLYHNKTINLFDKNITHTNQGDFFYWTDKKTNKIKKQPLWYTEAFFKNKKDRQKIRSKTFTGIAKAMALQWGNYLLNNKNQNNDTPTSV